MPDTNIPLYGPVPPKVEARWISPENPQALKGAGGTTNNGRKGAPCYGALAAGATMTLADYSGSSGIVRHIWTTISDRSPTMVRGLKVEFFWDGASTPAISVPWGDFFGCGLGEMPPFESELFTNPEGRNFNSYVPMPFRSGFKMTVTNETERDLDMYWMQIDLTIHDAVDDALYLHAWFNRENPTVPCEDYTFLPRIEGAGRYLGVNFGMQADARWVGAWWGEGEVKLYVDGDAGHPTLCGTGCEDYIGTSWGQGPFANRYQGCHFVAPGPRMCFYRYHIPDPIYFRTDIRGTIQQMGYHGPTQNAQWLFNKQEVLRAGTNEPIDVSEPGRGLFE
ncbi:MAG: DUF2961 domain-containing protein, partial [Verrucomicrobia bacterium]|nr:DUF2961 domain-containing protein [Verrucomicrobiota bacterium]